jgi:PilZ domain
MSRRREPRVELSFEVKAWGLDRHGKPFVQHARTLDITKAGAKLIGVDCVNVGEIIGVQNGDQKARFKVVWVGRENTPKAGQIGIHCLEPEKTIFTPAKNAPDETEREFFPRSAMESSFERVKNPRPVRKDAAASRRKHPRYPCTGGVELRQNENGPPAWGNISDISLTGCYVETMATLAVGSMVHFHLRTHNLEVRGRGVVKTSHHAVGIGLGFSYLTEENQQTLEFLIGTLAGIQEMRPEERQNFVPADDPGKNHEEAAVNAPSSAPGSLSEQITRIVHELAEMEKSLVRDKVDPRLIAQFHESMAHTRQTAWTVQQWLDLRSAGNDPFAVLPQLEAERINMLLKLSHNILADIDAGGVTEFTHGIEDLWNVVQVLHKRLARMFAELPGEDERDRKTFEAQR